ncbi:MAG: peptidase M15 [Alphaproteobacteria bacterium]|nr:peptidase M15 [Alphaproteobacteria bacterium]
MRPHIIESLDLPEGFAYLHDLFPSMQWDARYAGSQNFIGTSVAGYLEPAVVVSVPLANALAKAQDIFKSHEYEVVIYDSYRPQKAVEHFFRWSQDDHVDEVYAANYHPNLPKSMLFQNGYISQKSAHTRGCAIDMTLIYKGQKLKPMEAFKRVKNDGQVYTYFDDGTCDMGTHFDFLDEASHTESALVSESCLKLRCYFKDVMSQCGFDNYRKEWWHFQLVDEPFPGVYFDFDIQ